MITDSHKNGFAPFRNLKFRTGFTLVEVVVAIIISLIAVFGIGTLIIAAFNDWRTGGKIVNLQRDIDLASYKIKWVLEEADDDTPSNGGRSIVATCKTSSSPSFFQKEFFPALDNTLVYSASGNTLVYKDDTTNVSEEIIKKTLWSITFSNGSDNRSVRVDLTVNDGTIKNGTSQLSNSFLVYLRNAGGG
jgi:hypothetical protein